MSTYSPNLRIELITTGTQAGTWGNTTNTNLGTVIEDSIAGYITVSVIAANQAFTVIDGAADQARNAMIRVTTTTGANFSVYAPPVSKQYVLFNDSSYTATIYNSTIAGNTTAAGVGVTVPAGKTMTVWSDGTDFLVQNSHVIATAPTQTFGTNDTSIANTAFVQTALQAVYPVGAIYMSTGSTNPGSVFGFGTWSQLAPGRMLMGAGGSYAPGSTGGSANATLVSHTHTATLTGTSGGAGAHNHTVNDPGHAHGLGGAGSGGIPFVGSVVGTYDKFTVSNTTGISLNGVGDHTHSLSVAGTTDASGSSATDANLPPYLVVYMWQRTA